MKTDFIIALSLPTDIHHKEAVAVLRKHARKLKLSPHSLLELDMLVKAGRLKLKPVNCYKSLERLLEYYGVAIAEARPRHIAVAWQLRQRYTMLSYFDSLHAAVSIDFDEPITSYDKVYTGISGLNYIPLSSLAQVPTLTLGSPW